MKIKLFMFFMVCMGLHASVLDFDLYKKGNSGNTLLVIGGIHGDEPGGYFAASLLASGYKITKGEVWIVPNLNFHSIVKNRRGIYGDMNRKFDFVDPKDKDFKSVERIKAIITAEEIDFIANLHDGRGFYRQHWENALFNPSAWGQAFIIDQKKLDLDSEYKELDKFLIAIQENINKDLANNHHVFNIKDTKTKEKDEQMQQSLTYFAINHSKPAIAIETSKNIENLVQKVKYQLVALENIMQAMDIEFQRDFNLRDLQELSGAVNDFKSLKINDAITLELDNLKPYLYYFPLKKGMNEFEFEHPLGTVVRYKKRFDVMIGNKRLTSLYPQYFECYKDEDLEIYIEHGKEKQKVQLADVVTIKGDSFKIIADDAIRVNIIGYYNKAIDDEKNIDVPIDELIEKFSISKHPQYRVEFYKDEFFVGSIMVKLP